MAVKVENNQSRQAPGIGVDARGGGVIDPTKNVEDLVRALEIALSEFRKSDIKYVDTQLVAAEKLQNFARNAETKLNELSLAAETRLRDALRSADAALAAAETRRIDQLAQTRQEFQNTIRDMLAESVRTTSTLVSTQLVQIQATFDTRVSKLEAGAFTQAGKEQRPDPALADAVSQMANSMRGVQASNAEAMTKLATSISALQTTDEKTSSRGMGQGQVIGWIVGAAMLIAAIITPIIAFLALKPH